MISSVWQLLGRVKEKVIEAESKFVSQRIECQENNADGRCRRRMKSNVCLEEIQGAGQALRWHPS